MREERPPNIVQCPLQAAGVRRAEEAQLLLDYCARRLPPEEMAAFERHVSQCEDCRRFRDQQMLVWGALDIWETEPVRPEFNRELWDEVDVLEREPGWRKLKRGVAMAFEGISLLPAIPIAAVFSAWLLVVSWTPPAVKEPPPADHQPVERVIEDLELVEEIPLFIQ
jgi:hypothetical protein